MSKVFFTSYAHVNNRDKYLANFVRDLGSEVLDRSPGGGLTEGDVAFFDSEGIQTGEEWVEKLADAVRHCKVCVAILTPAYLASEFCGKEIQVFLQRLDEWRRKPENIGIAGRPIIPVLWIKAALPKVIADFQYDEAAFPKEYAEYGLKTLTQLSKFDDQRNLVRLVLAERIIAAAEQELPEGGPIPHFDFVPSSFHQTPKGMRYGVAVIAVVPGGIDFKPYGQEKTLRRLLQDSCGDSPWRALNQDGGLKQMVAAAKANREVICLLTNLETVNNPLFQGLISAVDAFGGEQSVLLVMRAPAPGGGSSNDSEVEITLKGCLPNSFVTFWHRDWVSIRSPETLEKSLKEVITAARTRLVNEDPARAARDPDLAAEATAKGVPIDRQPFLSGPGVK